MTTNTTHDLDPIFYSDVHLRTPNLEEYGPAMCERPTSGGEIKATPAMIEAAVDAYFGQNEREWEEDLEGCIREIVEAALAATSTVSAPPREGRI